MTTYIDVFGGQTTPPSEYSYVAVTLAANTTYFWPYNAEGDDVLAKIVEVTASSASLAMTLPPANEVSPGEDLLIRNVGAETFAVLDNAGGAIVSVAAGEAKYLYVIDNSSAAGGWGVVSYGVGTSSVDAATLVGYGIKAIGATLNQSHEVFTTASDISVVAADRAKLMVFTGGAGTVSLPGSSSLANDFFFLLRNAGTGTLTIDPSGAETIDGLATLDVQPGESLLLFCSGTTWYSVGYGRSVMFNFTQLVKDLSASSGGTVTLSASEASNKLLTFIGNPASTVTVVVPDLVAVYYILNSLSVATSVTVTTALGSGISVPQTQRVIAICDASNVYSAQSVSASTTVSLLDGSAASPSLNFASSTDSGLYKYNVEGVGITSNGTRIAHFDQAAGSEITTLLNVVGNFTVATNKFSVAAATGNTTWASGAILSAPSGKLYIPTVGPDADSQHTLPDVAADTITLNAATQTLTNKTINLTSNTLVATSAQLAAALTDETGTGAAVFAGSPALTGTPTAPTAAAGTNTTQLATTAHVFAERTNTATLTNKTLTSPTLSGAPSAAAATWSNLGAVTTVDINGGTIDSTAIGATTPSTGAFTTLTASGLTTTNGQVAFPATQNPSANANTLDDYEEGSWTPALTFATPGNLSVAYSVQVGRYTKIGNIVNVSATILTTSFTHTSASGNAQITGLPFTSESVTGLQFYGAMRWQGITKAAYSEVSARVENGATYTILSASGSGQTNANVTASDMPTGGTVILSFTATYRV